MNRKSFYYHFRDKYDLINWIFYTEFVNSILKNPSSTSWDLLNTLCEYFYENKSFYRKTLPIERQNSMEMPLFSQSKNGF
ncbi:MAG TPA: hypothetical protein H9740_09285 [Candidatus Hungatella pullicola]|nr:hypothetical protein [Candidatus Hungatella pullicola]